MGMFEDFLMIATQFDESFVYRKSWGNDYCDDNIDKAISITQPRFEYLWSMAKSQFSEVNKTEKVLYEARFDVLETLWKIYRLSKNGAINWKDEKVTKEIEAIADKHHRKLGEVDFSKCSIEVLNKLGFQVWEKNLLLFPLWAYAIWPKETQVISIFGEASTIAECNNDSRMGCIAYGVVVSEIL